MIELNLILFGIARDIAGSGKIKLSIENGASVSMLKQKLEQDFPSFSDLTSLSFAVNTEYVDDTYVLKNEEEVVVIPPVSGG